MLQIVKFGIQFVIWGSVAAMMLFVLISAIFTQQIKDLAAPIYCNGRVEQTVGGRHRSRFICFHGKQKTDVTILASIVHMSPFIFFSGILIMGLLAQLILLLVTNTGRSLDPRKDNYMKIYEKKTY